MGFISITPISPIHVASRLHSFQTLMLLTIFFFVCAYVEDYHSILNRKSRLLYSKMRALKFTEEIKKALSEPACEPNSFNVIQLGLDPEQSNKATLLFTQNDKSGMVPYLVVEGGSTVLSMLCLK